MCYPETTFHRTYRGFWSWYRRTYSATTYSQQTIIAHYLLTNNPNYNQARESARDIIFSCRYSTPLNNPKNIIETLLANYTRYTLRSYIPLNFNLTPFDAYIEHPTNSLTNNPCLNRTPEEALGNLGSPIPNQYQSDLDQFEFSHIRTDLVLEPEYIDSPTTPFIFFNHLITKILLRLIFLH